MNEWTKDELMIHFIAREDDRANDELKKFAKNFETNPEYAFRWADSAMVAANTRKQLDYIQRVILAKRGEASDVRAWLLSQILQLATDGKSTSEATNAMRDANLRAAKGLYDAFRQYVEE